MERYCRNIVYRRWPGDQFRPTASFDTLYDAVKYVDTLPADTTFEFKVIDVEHIDLGDMLTATECADLVSAIRTEIRAVAAGYA